MRDLELLAPAGDINVFKKVIDAGADAVYFGGDLFSARAYANNFSKEEAEQAIDYAHVRGKKAYLTLNTLLKNQEILKDLYDYMLFYNNAGLDGVIIQDFGVFNFVKEFFPEIELHASTQMTLNSKYGAQFLKDAGASRIVTSRELSLQEIKEIYDETQIEIEAFVHGALCMSYSGQCLMSSIIGGRSGNRGRCAQPCRLPYDVYEDGQQINKKGQFQLSPKDLCGINDLEAMAKAGVISYKVEGRMKQVEYAMQVVSIYRYYLDMLAETGHISVSDGDYQALLKAGNRCGFTNSYFYNHNDNNMITYSSPSHEKKDDLAIDDCDSRLGIDGYFYGHVGENLILSLNYQDHCISVTGPLVEEASNRPMNVEDIKKKLNKTGASDFKFNSLDLDIDNNVFIPVSSLNEIRRQALDELKGELCLKRQANELNKEELNCKYNDLCSYDSKIVGTNHYHKPYIIANTHEQLQAITDHKIEAIVCISYKLLDLVTNTCQYYVVMPPIFRNQDGIFFEKFKDQLLQAKGIVVNSFDEIEYIKGLGIDFERVILSPRIYTYSDIAKASYMKIGFKHDIIPLELNYKELTHRDNHDSLMLVYGYYPLMTMANCLNKNNNGCDKKSHNIILKDRKNAEFKVINNCDLCYNLIYNSLPTCLFKEAESIEKLGLNNTVLEFTIENRTQVYHVLDLYSDYFEKKQKTDIDFEYTTGHYKRGVM